ncbi:unnamed protein product [Tenebrio molitor]|nr:unnamed protein product [Tenebrio molitor]
MSLFQDGTLEIDNPQSREEDEELEEQRRRQEELTDLLATGIHAFNYDDSTINSSATSAEGVEPNYLNQVKNRNQFKYEDSEKTLLDNVSSSVSGAIEQNYKNVNQQDQLKLLYEVRLREINSLREEFQKFKEEKSKEISVLKNKVTLSEAEIRHLQITLSNSESLLVEKNGIINNFKQNMTAKDHEVENLQKVIEQQNLEICTYTATINELQLKQSDNNPFNVGARKFKSEELQKAHQDRVVKLETLLQEQSKKVQILEKEKSRLEEDVKRLIKNKDEIEEENNLTIMGLSKKLQSTQQQCKDLFLLGEAIKKESDHFKERMQQVEINKLDSSEDTCQAKKKDKDTMMVHMEKLKRMLLDKDIENNTLKAKLKFYESDLNELFEYREILSNMYLCEVKPCSNGEHEELIIFMQRQLQSYQQAVEDRNNQIMNLNMVNKELQEKIEEMIQQTRTDIQNLSQKYSLPKLETMSNELKNAEETISALKKELKESKSAQEELLKKIEKACVQNDNLQQTAIKEKENHEKLLSEMNIIEDEKNKLLVQIEEFKKAELQLTEENEKVKVQLRRLCLKLGLSEADIFEHDGDVHEVNSLKLKYGKVHDQLQQVVVYLENMNLKRANFNLIFALKKQVQNYLNSFGSQNLEKSEIGEKLEQWDNMLSDFIESFTNRNTSTEVDVKELELKDNIEELTNAKTMLEGEKFALEYQLKSRTDELEAARKEIVALTENKKYLLQEKEENVRVIQKLNDQINNLKKCLKLVEENKAEVEKQLENTQKQLNAANEESVELHKEVSEVNENVVRRNLFKELKDVENILEQESTNNEIQNNDIFQKCLQAQILKAELILRDRLQEEGLEKMQKIEEQYKNIIVQKNEMYNKEKEKWKNQEANYRRQFAAVLEECGKKMEELEKDNIILIRRINVLVNEYKVVKRNATRIEEQYSKAIAQHKKSIENMNKHWASLVEFYSANAKKIQKQSQKSVKNILKKISLNQAEMNFIENVYEEKMNKIKSEIRNS